MPGTIKVLIKVQACLQILHENFIRFWSRMSSATSRRQKPNILIAGTPGTGKTTISKQLEEMTQFNHIEVGEFAKKNNLLESWDAKYNCHIIDEDKVKIATECYANALIIYSMGYDEAKIRENVECEIFQEIVCEAQDSYREDVVMELQNDSLKDIESNVNHIRQWIDSWTGVKK
ncbi:Adenylate kinase isoenzyme 6-like protein [Trichoplax sp. H2]|nr:Adenylate kinase isoenzyme 6-like protein [Trichoplax sp. H2]|eukprot:RDD39705.1 Adenylate kinase isoenzyme 6-like protein [Trichoplax sp. H2]